MWVDEEECQDLPMARFRLVLELERLDLMLKDVRESDQATLRCLDRADVLDCIAPVRETEHLSQPIVLVLGVWNLADGFRI